jgi:hypothetical protein
VFRRTRPTPGEVDAFLAAQHGAAFSYAHVGATRGAAPAGYPAGYTVDHRRVRVGAGGGDYRRRWRRCAPGA